MSHNQSRADTRESYQYKRSGSFNQHRGGGRGSGGGRGGGAAAPPPPVSSTSNPSLTSNKSFNKKYNNVQGGQPRVSGASAGAGVGSDSHLNGAHQQQPLRGASDVSVASAHAPLPNAATVKPTDASTQKVTRAVPRAPTSNVVAPTSDLTAPVTPAKNPGDASRSFPLQFGSISPGVMNVLQIPERTSSAPPNLDVQKRAQACSDTSRAIPSLPNPSTSKQPMPRKDAGPIDPSNPSDAHGVASKPRRDVQISAPPPVAQTQKATHPMPGMHMPIPFHQPQVPVQFGGPGPQIPSHSMSATSLPMPMHLPIVNPPMQQPMFVSGLQPHPMQSQGMMHQGKGLNFSSGMGPQLPPQLGNMGMNMPSHFSPQQAGKFLGQRKTVKITHPDTHEELRLDVTHGSRSHPNMPPQSQPIAPFPPGHPNYYPNSYNSSSVFFLASSTLPLGNTQSSQPPRSFSQVTVKPAAGGTHPGKEQLPPVSSAAFGKDPVYFNSRASDVSVASAHAPLPNATVKPTDASTQKVTRAVPRAPTSNIVAPTSELMAPVTPAKRASDVSVTGLVSKSSSGVKKKSLVDSNVPKVTVTRGKKKRKCIYKKADAAGATSDLYMAYKGPEKKDELTESIEAIELTSSDNSKPLSADAPQEDLRSTKKVGEAKAVPDDWEDAADVSTPKLEADPEHGKKVDGEDGDGLTTKKYSRDFLLKFQEQCIDIPEGFNVAPDIAASVSREPCPSPGRGIDRPSSGHRERRVSGFGDADKWSKTPGPLMRRRDLQPDFVYGGNVMGFRPGPGGNYGVLPNPCATMPIQYAGEEEPDPYRTPTKQNMRMALYWLVQGCQPGDSLLFHYSGHGS